MLLWIAGEESCTGFAGLFEEHLRPDASSRRNTTNLSSSYILEDPQTRADHTHVSSAWPFFLSNIFHIVGELNSVHV